MYLYMYSKDFNIAKESFIKKKNEGREKRALAAAVLSEIAILVVKLSYITMPVL